MASLFWEGNVLLWFQSCEEAYQISSCRAKVFILKRTCFNYVLCSCVKFCVYVKSISFLLLSFLPPRAPWQKVRRATRSRAAQVCVLLHSWCAEGYGDLSPLLFGRASPLPNCNLPATIAVGGNRKTWATRDPSPRQWIIITIECWLGSSSSSFTGGGWRGLKKELGGRSRREGCDEPHSKYCFVQGLPQVCVFSALLSWSLEDSPSFSPLVITLI